MSNEQRGLEEYKCLSDALFYTKVFLYLRQSFLPKRFNTAASFSIDVTVIVISNFFEQFGWKGSVKVLSAKM